MKIDPTVYQKRLKKPVGYKEDEWCCAAHEEGRVLLWEECDHTSPWED